MNPLTNLLWNSSDPILSGGFFLCIKVFPVTVRDYTGPIVLSTDTNAYVAISFICNSPWVMTMKSYDGWQGFDPVVKTLRVNYIVIMRASPSTCFIVWVIYSHLYFAFWLTGLFYPLFPNNWCNYRHFPHLRGLYTGVFTYFIDQGAFVGRWEFSLHETKHINYYKLDPTLWFFQLKRNCELLLHLSGWERFLLSSHQPTLLLITPINTTKCVCVALWPLAGLIETCWQVAVI